MFELIICSMLTHPAGLPLPPLCPGQAVRQGDHVLFSLVRVAMGHHRLRDAHGVPDHHDLLLPSVNQLGDAVFPHGADSARELRTGRGSQCRLQRSGEEGRCTVQAGQLKQQAALETARRKIAEVDAAMSCRGSRRGQGRSEDTGGQGQPPAGHGRTERQDANCNAAIRASCRNATSKSCRCSSTSGRPALMRPPHPSSRRRCGFRRCCRPRRPAPKPRWREAQVDLDKTFVRAGVDGRVEQFALRVGDVVNPLMRPAGVLIPEGAGRRGLAGRLWPDRGSGDESRHGRGSDLRLEALGDHPDGRHQRAGLHRGRPVPRRGATHRSAECQATRARSSFSWSRSTRAVSKA